jgi:hypothetical protein
MSDRTHQYRQLSRRDPATTAEMFARDADGNQVPLVTSADGKLIVEVSGGGGGTASEVVIKGTVPAVPAVPNPADPDGPPLEPAVPAYAVKVKSNPSGEISVVPKDDALVALRGLVPEVVEVPGVNPGDPPLVEGVDAYLTDLSATASGELLVAPKDDALVALRGLVPEVPERPDPSDPLAPPLPMEPAYLTDLLATSEGDLNVLVRGLVPEVVEVPGALPGAPPIVAGVPAYPTALRATEDGELAVAITAPVSLMAREDGLSPAADVRLVANGDGALHVAIENSVTVPVEVQGVAEVKATSTSVWNFGKANGPFTHPDVTDADGWMDLRAFSRFAATAIASGYTYDLAEGFLPYGAATVHVVTDWTTLTAAITAAASGDVILLRNGSYTMPSATALAVNKPLTLIGESREGVIVQTTATETAGLVTICNVTSSDVTIASMTFRWQWFRASTSQEACIVAEGTNDTRYSRIRLENLTLEHIEEGIRGRFADSRIANCELKYVGRSVTANDHRAIRLRSLAGQFELLDCVFSTATSVAGNLRAIWFDPSTSGTIDSFSGTAIIARNGYAPGSKVFQVLEMPCSSAVIPGALRLEVRGNVFREQNGFVIFSGLVDNTLNFLTEIVLENNDIANGTAEFTGKGFVALDAGSGTTLRTVRTSSLPLFASGNTSVYVAARADYSELAGNLVVARTSSVAPFTVNVFTDIPESTAPAATGSNLLIYWSGNLQVQYKVVDAEPVGQTLSTTAINGTYHAIIDPTDPQDILGIGRVRLVATNATPDLGGYYAAFAVAK